MRRREEDASETPKLDVGVGRLDRQQREERTEQNTTSFGKMKECATPFLSVYFLLSCHVIEHE